MVEENLEFEIGEIVKIRFDELSSFHVFCVYKDFPSSTYSAPSEFIPYKNLNQNFKYMVSDIGILSAAEGAGQSNRAYAKLIGPDFNFWISASMLRKA